MGWTVRVSLLGTGKSVANPGGHDTPPRNAAQFNVLYANVWPPDGEGCENPVRRPGRPRANRDNPRAPVL